MKSMTKWFDLDFSFGKPKPSVEEPKPKPEQLYNAAVYPSVEHFISGTGGTTITDVVRIIYDSNNNIVYTKTGFSILPLGTVFVCLKL